MAAQAIALGHVGMMLGILGLLLSILEFYNASVPSPNSGVIFFPLVAWTLGLLFVVGEWFEAKRST